MKWTNDRTKLVDGESYIVVFRAFDDDHKIGWEDEVCDGYFRMEDTDFEAICWMTLDDFVPSDEHFHESNDLPQDGDYYIVKLKDGSLNFAGCFGHGWDNFGGEIVGWYDWPEIPDLEKFLPED